MGTLRAEIREEEEDDLRVWVDVDFDANASHMALVEHEVVGLDYLDDSSSPNRLSVRGVVPDDGDGLVSIWAEVACFVDESVRAELAYVWDVSEGDKEIWIRNLIASGTFEERLETDWAP